MARHNRGTKLSAFCLLLGLASSALASQAITVYGLKSASNYHAKSQGPKRYYLQVATFRNKNNASRYQSAIKRKTAYPVKLHQTQAQSMWVVVIGPIDSDAKLRQTASRLMQSPPTVKPQTVHANKNQALSSSTVKVMPISAKGNQQDIMGTWDPGKGKATPSPIEPSGTCDNCLRNWFIGGDIGYSSPSMNGDSIFNGTVLPYPFNYDHYNDANPGSGVLLSFLAGYRWETMGTWFPHYSAAFRYRHYFQNTLDGDVVQFSIPAFNNYRYSLDFSSDVFSFLFKTNIYQWNDWVSPYVSASLGVAYNRVKKYRESAKSGVIARVSPAFGKNHNTSLTYSFGLGLDLMMNQFWTVSLGYEYEDLRKYSTANGTGLWSQQALSFGSAHSNNAVLSVTYQLPA